METSPTATIFTKGVLQVRCSAQELQRAAGGGARALRRESIVQVRGVVRERPSAAVNERAQHGRLEVAAERVELVNACAVDELPISLVADEATGQQASEAVRQRYRFLELRRAPVQRVLRARSALGAAARTALLADGFVEVETPTLFRRTSEGAGAQEFLVPTRRRGLCYALPQSPQQYKQMLMAGGIDRYFQFARCYRDEPARADRQPEFTQLDIEMAFATMDDVMALCERVVGALVPTSAAASLPRLSFAEAMRRYGTDKPDTRYGHELHAVAEGDAFLAQFRSVQAVVARQVALSGSQFAALAAHCKMGDSVCVPLRVGADGAFEGGAARKCSDTELQRVADACGGDLRAGDLVVLCCSATSEANAQLAAGRARLELIERMVAGGSEQRAADGDLRFLWVVDFPLFELDDDGRLAATHHPFTAPHGDDEALLAAAVAAGGKGEAAEGALDIRAQHYDLVLNGVEVAGGSVRVHNAERQRAIMRHCLRMSEQQIDEFEHLLQALEYGCPPHAGIAFGWDRLVSMLLAQPTIRDVIAFPKNAQGDDLLTGAPAQVSEESLRQYHLRFNEQ